MLTRLDSFQDRMISVRAMVFFTFFVYVIHKRQILHSGVNGMIEQIKI